MKKNTSLSFADYERVRVKKCREYVGFLLCQALFLQCIFLVCRSGFDARKAKNRLKGKDKTSACEDLNFVPTILKNSAARAGWKTLFGYDM